MRTHCRRCFSFPADGQHGRLCEHGPRPEHRNARTRCVRSAGLEAHAISSGPAQEKAGPLHTSSGKAPTTSAALHHRLCGPRGPTLPFKPTEVKIIADRRRLSMFSTVVRFSAGSGKLRRFRE